MKLDKVCLPFTEKPSQPILFSLGQMVKEFIKGHEIIDFFQPKMITQGNKVTFNSSVTARVKVSQLAPGTKHSALRPTDLYCADWNRGSCTDTEATVCHVTTLINHALQCYTGRIILPIVCAFLVFLCVFLCVSFLWEWQNGPCDGFTY